MCAIGIKFHQGCQFNRLTGGEVPGSQRFVSLDGIQDFLHLSGLTASEVGRFESTGVVFAFRLAALMRGLLMRCMGGFIQNAEALGEASDNLSSQFSLHHSWAMFRAGILNQSAEG